MYKESQRYIIFLSAVLSLLVLFLYFYNIDTGSLDHFDEGLSALRSIEMLKNGNWMTAHAHGEPTLNKPTLYYIVTSQIMKVFGPTDFSVRLFSCVLGMLCIALCYLITFHITASYFYALFASVCLLFTPHWMNETRQGLLESGFSLSMLAFLYFFVRSSYSVTSGVIGGLALSFGAWLKNPLVLVVTLPPFVFSLLNVKVHSFAKIFKYWSSVFGAFFSVGMSWYIYQSFALPELFWGDFVRYNVAKRVSEGIEGHLHDMQFYLYVAQNHSAILLGFFLVSLVIAALVRKRRNSAYWLVLATSLTWFVLILASVSKRHTYLVPIYPFCAVFVASTFYHVMGKSRAGLASLVLATVLFAGAFFSNGLHAYKSPLDFNPHLKRLSLEAGGFMDADDSVTTIQIPGQLVSFYTGKTSFFNYYSWNTAEEVFSRAMISDRGEWFIIAKKEDKEHIGDVLAESFPQLLPAMIKGESGGLFLFTVKRDRKASPAAASILLL